MNADPISLRRAASAHLIALKKVATASPRANDNGS